MAFSRAIASPAPPSFEGLTASLIGIGFLLAGEGTPAPNIEDTLLWASLEGMKGDFRVLAILATWFGVHARYVNADRLTCITQLQAPKEVQGFWAGLAYWQRKDSRWRRLGARCRGARVMPLPQGTEFQIKRHGEDPRFLGSPLRVPANFLRDRPADVLTPKELAARHPAYRARVLIGPTYRADMWAALEADQDLTTAELARRAYGSFATAWEVRRDFTVWRLSAGAR
jgi:hypothetical protein